MKYDTRRAIERRRKNPATSAQSFLHSNAENSLWKWSVSHYHRLRELEENEREMRERERKSSNILDIWYIDII